MTEASSPVSPGALSGRAALVTGAGRGLGRAIAMAMGAAGAEVTLVSRTRSELDGVAAEITGAGGRASTCVADVTDEAAVRDALEGRGPFDILVNCAGGNRPQPFADVEIATFDALMAVNVRSTFIVTQQVVRRLLDADRPGVVLNITSQMGHVGARDRSVYCAAKHAVEGFTKALGVELAPRGIRVVAIAPTFVETPLTRPFFADPAFKAEVLASIPLGRLGEPEEVAAAAALLARPAASLITATSVLLDGGWTAR